MSSFFKQFKKHSQRIALQDKNQTLNYEQLLNQSQLVSQQIQNKIQKKNPKILFITEKNTQYPIIQFGIWGSQGISIPVCPSTAYQELNYFIKDSKPDLIITNDNNLNKIESLSHDNKIPYLLHNKQDNKKIQYLNENQADENQDALILYTSGTTGQPKGVVHTHKSLESQIKSLSQAWQWSQNDHIVQFLPLNHIHGLQNVLNCSLYNGAFCEMIESYDTRKIWDILLRDQKQPTIFMAVPSIYYSLANYYEKKLDKQQTKEKLQKLRLMVSGSSALPEKEMLKWQKISGQDILERFGMTEIGMGLSNTLDKKIPGFVGKCLPNVEASLMQENGIISNENSQQGELLIKSQGMFDRYYNKENETKQSFINGWFKTGDFAQIDQNGNYQILGRLSIDIIKKSGWKISALEIENTIRQYQGIEDVAVIGVNDEKYGQEIACIIVSENKMDLQKIKNYCIENMSQYKVPQIWKQFDQLPRNHMGKVNKKQLGLQFQ